MTGREAGDGWCGAVRSEDVPHDCVARVELPAVLPLPADLMERKVIEYPADRARELEAIVKEVLDLPGDTDLAKLHETARGEFETARRAAEGRSGRLTGYHRKWQARMKADAGLWRRFQVVYQCFLREVVVPDLGEDEELIFQVWPTFRCHLPNTTKGIGRRHRDYDYLHPAIEVNYWIPIGCDTHGSNSLYCETAPGRRDFTPFATTGDELVRFYGNALEHFTLANTTGTTRVSLDARVIRSKDYYNAALDRGHAGNPKPDLQFVVGRYYSSFRLADPLEIGVEDAVQYFHPNAGRAGGDAEEEAEADGGEGLLNLFE
eukprot:TRINITY_DN6562_c0_g1_i1.p2 TRINITY_DN6562_c0_g1~~TRINITY_DN6562_c0_g1_i1.p2  ORF type:complete len:319 (+),score=105.82 TRINITY_DN6562_c0_g1_i1:102-1058(+)